MQLAWEESVGPTAGTRWPVRRRSLFSTDLKIRPYWLMPGTWASNSGSGSTALLSNFLRSARLVDWARCGPLN